MSKNVIYNASCHTGRLLTLTDPTRNLHFCKSRSSSSGAFMKIDICRSDSASLAAEVLGIKGCW